MSRTRLLAALLLLPALGGCALALGGAALGGAVVVTDRRSVGAQIEDAEIEHRIRGALDEHFARTSVRIDVTAYEQRVLLAGQVPREEDRHAAETIASGTHGVHEVTNALTLGTLAGLSSRTDDSLLDGKVRAALLDVSGMPTGAVKVSCTDGVAYLFGRVSPWEAETAKRVTKGVNGVRRVVALFTLEAAAPVSAPAPGEPANAAGAANGPAAPAAH
jgi:osmotically-inducible protein OsmY